MAATTETDDVLVVTLPAAGAPKRSKGSWPPVPVGKCFIVAKEDAEKWPPKQHTSMVANAKFMVTWRFSSLFESDSRLKTLKRPKVAGLTGDDVSSDPNNRN